MLSFGRFLIDCASLVVSVAGLTAGAYGVRRRVLPVWRGAPARLAEIIFAIALLVIVAQILALAGGFVTRWVVPACLVAGAAGWWVGRGHRRPVGQPLGSEAPATAPAWTLAALAAIAVTVAQWGVGVRDALTHGMTTHDTLFYHGPDVARFVQGGSPLDQSYAYSDPVVNFFPMNSELIHAFGVVLMGFDSLSPFITLAWLGVAFLAAWCIGRPYGLGAPAVCVRGSGARLATARLEPSPAGMYNDIAVIALILGAAALLMNGADRAPAIIAPAAACGLAIGTKLTALSLVGALTVGLLWLSPRSRRAATLGAWTAVLTVLAGVWFLRNVIDTGNPTPGLELRLGSRLASQSAPPRFVRDRPIPREARGLGTPLPARSGERLYRDLVGSRRPGSCRHGSGRCLRALARREAARTGSSVRFHRLPLHAAQRGRHRELPHLLPVEPALRSGSRGSRPRPPATGASGESADVAGRGASVARRRDGRRSGSRRPGRTPGGSIRNRGGHTGGRGALRCRGLPPPSQATGPGRVTRYRADRGGDGRGVAGRAQLSGGPLHGLAAVPRKAATGRGARGRRRRGWHVSAVRSQPQSNRGTDRQPREPTVPSCHWRVAGHGAARFERAATSSSI